MQVYAYLDIAVHVDYFVRKSIAMHALYDRAGARDPLRAGHHHAHHQEEHAGQAVVQLVHKTLRICLQQFLLSEYWDVVPYGAEQPYHGGHVGDQEEPLALGYQGWLTHLSGDIKQ